ncbi:hypothetical protein HQ545_02085 [Candidatus Woesearchaeota archaeon]|nr:hypothetical protein [Candidatus Woesearchaeota archaeon]
MKLKIPEIRTVDDYYRALFGTAKVEEETSSVLGKLKEDAVKRRKDLDGKFNIEELDDRYRFHNLEYRDGIYTVDWSKELLDGGNSHTQEEWTGIVKDNEFGIPSAPLYHATIKLLYENQDHPVAEQQDLVQVVREVFQKDFTDYYMMTSTRIKYSGKKKKQQPDVVTHDWNTPQARITEGSFVGPNGYVKPGCGFDDVIQAVLESNDTQLIEEAYEWIGKETKKPYLYRINNTPDNDVERAVVLGVVVNNRFNINDIIDVSRPVRGVVTQRKKILHEK